MEKGYYSDDINLDISFNDDLEDIVFDKVRSSIRMAQGKVVTTSDFNRLKNKIDTMEMPKGN